MKFEQDNIIRENSTLAGRFLFRCDIIMHNFKFYIKRHSISIEIFFLLIYTGLNLGLVYRIQTATISVFIIIFLFFLGLERLIIHLKSNIDKELLEKKEEQIKEDFGSYIDELEKQIGDLEKKYNVLERQNDILKFSLKNNSKLKEKR